METAAFSASTPGGASSTPLSAIKQVDQGGKSFVDFFLVENKEFVQEEAEGIGLEGKEKDKGEEDRKWGKKEEKKEMDKTHSKVTTQ